MSRSLSCCSRTNAAFLRWDWIFFVDDAKRWVSDSRIGIDSSKESREEENEDKQSESVEDVEWSDRKVGYSDVHKLVSWEFSVLISLLSVWGSLRSDGSGNEVRYARYEEAWDDDKYFGPCDLEDNKSANGGNKIVSSTFVIFLKIKLTGMLVRPPIYNTLTVVATGYNCQSHTMSRSNLDKYIYS